MDPEPLLRSTNNAFERLLLESSASDGAPAAVKERSLELVDRVLSSVASATSSSPSLTILKASGGHFGGSLAGTAAKHFSLLKAGLLKTGLLKAGLVSVGLVGGAIGAGLAWQHGAFQPTRVENESSLSHGVSDDVSIITIEATSSASPRKAATADVSVGAGAGLSAGEPRDDLGTEAAANDRAGVRQGDGRQASDRASTSLASESGQTSDAAQDRGSFEGRLERTALPPKGASRTVANDGQTGVVTKFSPAPIAPRGSASSSRRRTEREHKSPRPTSSAADRGAVQSAGPGSRTNESASLREEVRLIEVIRSRLKARRAAEALQAVATYGSRFPNGILAPEVAVLRERALALQGRH